VAEQASEAVDRLSVDGGRAAAARRDGDDRLAPAIGLDAQLGLDAPIGLDAQLGPDAQLGLDAEHLGDDGRGQRELPPRGAGGSGG